MSKSDWLLSLESELANSNPRSLLIVVSATLHDELEELVKLHLAPPRTNTDRLFDGRSPLGTFSATITIAERLGIIDKNVSSVINIIRRIRNRSAHATEPIDLGEPPASDRIDEIQSRLHSIVDPDDQYRHKILMLSVNVISTITDAQRNKKIKEDQSDMPHACKVWIDDGIINQYAHEVGQSPQFFA
jgi:hypothetical protein